jgi:hypothetical protein
VKFVPLVGFSGCSRITMTDMSPSPVLATVAAVGNQASGCGASLSILLV